MIEKKSHINLLINNLSVGYQGKLTTKILDGFTVKVGSPKLICVLGKNGAGKTTLLKTLAGLLPELEGYILINDKDFSNLTWAQRANLQSSVFTDYNKAHNFDVKTIVSMARQTQQYGLGRLSETDHNAISRAISIVNLEEIEQKPFNKLSDGQRQKVMIAKAIAQETPLMLLDEPTVHLDIDHVMELFLLFRNLVNQHHKTIILTTHEVELALKMADEIWLIDEGKVHIGTIQEIIKKELIQNVFDTENVSFNKETGRFQYKYEVDKL